LCSIGLVTALNHDETLIPLQYARKNFYLDVSKIKIKAIVRCDGMNRKIRCLSMALSLVLGRSLA